jgi:uncharacterized protein YjbJ (UPF0337 family)
VCVLLFSFYSNDLTKTRLIMSSSTSDKIEGDAHRVKGAVKEEIGYLVGNEKMEAEGKAENIDGQIQHKVGDVKAVFGK